MVEKHPKIRNEIGNILIDVVVINLSRFQYIGETGTYFVSNMVASSGCNLLLLVFISIRSNTFPSTEGNKMYYPHQYSTFPYSNACDINLIDTSLTAYRFAQYVREEWDNS